MQRFVQSDYRTTEAALPDRRSAVPADIDFPVYDADNHLYEAEDALTRHLPEAHRNLFRFVEIKGRKKLVVRNRLTEFIPNPTFEVVARPGAHMAFYAGDNAEGKTLRELTGEPMRSIPAFREPRAPPRAARRAGHPRLPDVPDARQPDRGAAARRPATSPRSRSARSTSGCTTSGATTTRVASSRRRSSTRASSTRASPSSSGCIERGAKAVLLRPAPVSGLRGTRSPFLAGVRPVLGPRPGGRVPRGAPRVRQRLPGVPEHVGGQRAASTSRSARRPSPPSPTTAARSRTRSRRRSATGCSTASPACASSASRTAAAGSGHLGQATWSSRTRRCRTSSPSTRSRCSSATSGSTRSGRTRSTGSSSSSGADRVCFGSDFPHPEGLDDPLAFAGRASATSGADVERIMSTNLKSLLAA